MPYFSDGVRRISPMVFWHRREDFFSRLECAAREPGGRGARGRRRRSREARVGRRMRACRRHLLRIAARPRARCSARVRIASPARDARKKPRDRNELRAKRRGDGRGPWDFQRGLLPVSNGAMPPERERDVEGVPSCAWVTTADPRRRSRPCRSSRGRGRIETSVEESRMWETACRLLLRVRCLFFSLLG